MTPSTTATFRRAPLFSRLLGLTVLVAVFGGVLVGSAPSASAAATTNGITMNGITVNGISTNGITTNGITMNGIGLNGISLNGITMNGIATNGIPLQGLTLKGLLQALGALRVTKLDSEQPPPASAHRLPWHRISQTAVGQR